ncbi:MAG: GIY-YIG nuclease family protein [Clostridia bacterium]|nr:GIY-YIG nuclease family protein [Clostridia bacterium]
MYYVYILSNTSRSVLYIGVTNDLLRRVYEHKTEAVDGFTKRYHVHDLMYYEEYSYMQDAIAREKQLKRWTRAKKDALIEQLNPAHTDLYRTILR